MERNPSIWMQLCKILSVFFKPWFPLNVQRHSSLFGLVPFSQTLRNKNSDTSGSHQCLWCLLPPRTGLGGRSCSRQQHWPIYRGQNNISASLEWQQENTWWRATWSTGFWKIQTLDHLHSAGIFVWPHLTSLLWKTQKILSFQCCQSN